MAKNPYVGSAAADDASAYFNSLPFEERKKLAPLLDHYRQMGLAEALGYLQGATQKLTGRIRGIREADADPLAARDERQ